MELKIKFDVVLAFKGLIPDDSLDFLKAIWIENNYVDTCRQIAYHKSSATGRSIADNWARHGAKNLTILFDNLLRKASVLVHKQVVHLEAFCAEAIPMLTVGNKTSSALRDHLVTLEDQYNEDAVKLKTGDIKIIAESFGDEDLQKVQKRNESLTTNRERMNFNSSSPVDQIAKQLQLLLFEAKQSEEFHDKYLFPRLMWFKHGAQWDTEMNKLTIATQTMKVYREYITSTFIETGNKTYLETSLEPQMYEDIKEKQRVLRAKIAEESKGTTGWDTQSTSGSGENTKTKDVNSKIDMVTYNYLTFENSIFVKVGEEVYVSKFPAGYHGVTKKECTTNILKDLNKLGAKLEFQEKASVANLDPDLTKMSVGEKEGDLWIAIANPLLKKSFICAMRIVGDESKLFVANHPAAILVYKYYKETSEVLKGTLRGGKPKTAYEVHFESSIVEWDKANEEERKEANIFYPYNSPVSDDEEEEESEDEEEKKEDE